MLCVIGAALVLAACGDTGCDTTPVTLNGRALRRPTAAQFEALERVYEAALPLDALRTAVRPRTGRLSAAIQKLYVRSVIGRLGPCVALAFAIVALAGGGVASAQVCAAPAYPGDTASREAIAQWMAYGAGAAGLPRELPVMGAIVESGLHNLAIADADADADGYFQTRTSIWNRGEYAGFPEHPELQLKWFTDQAAIIRRAQLAAGGPDPAVAGNTWGSWIADVLRPAEQFRGRYQLRLGEARALIGAACIPDATGAPSVPPGTPPAPGTPPPPPPAADTVAPAVELTGQRRQRALAAGRSPSRSPVPPSAARPRRPRRCACPGRGARCASPPGRASSRAAATARCAWRCVAATARGCARRCGRTRRWSPRSAPRPSTPAPTSRSASARCISRADRATPAFDPRGQANARRALRTPASAPPSRAATPRKTCVFAGYFARSISSIR
jgi:hypothetical protein